LRRISREKVRERVVGSLAERELLAHGGRILEAAERSHHQSRIVAG
jgi:hypothetical protein